MAGDRPVGMARSSKTTCAILWGLSTPNDPHDVHNPPQDEGTGASADPTTSRFPKQRDTAPLRGCEAGPCAGRSVRSQAWAPGIPSVANSWCLIVNPTSTTTAQTTNIAAATQNAWVEP